LDKRHHGESITSVEHFDGPPHITIAVDRPAPSAEALEIALHAATNAARGVLEIARDLRHRVRRRSPLLRDCGAPTMNARAAKLPDGTYFGRGELDRFAAELRRRTPKPTLEAALHRVAVLEADTDVLRSIVSDYVARVQELEHDVDELAAAVGALLERAAESK
jgi:hypothetical protein